MPPGAGKGKQNSSDRPGAASGTGNAQVASDLARTKEALASREQEVGELKSRVKDLEKIDGDNKRLLSLKQNEIAELQAKLKQLEAASAAKPAAVAAVTPAPAKPAETKPAEAPAAKPGEAASAKEAPKLTAKDIWGDINASEKPGEAKPGAAPAPATATPAPAAKAPESTAPATAAATPGPAAAAAPKPAEVKPTETKPGVDTGRDQTQGSGQGRTDLHAGDAMVAEQQFTDGRRRSIAHHRPARPDALHAQAQGSPHARRRRADRTR